MIDALDNILADLIQSQVPALAKTGQIGFDAPNEEWRRDVVNTNAERANIYLCDMSYEDFLTEWGLPATGRAGGAFGSTVAGVWRRAFKLPLACPRSPRARPLESPAGTTASADYRQQGEPESAEVWLSIGGHILAPKSALPVLGAYVEIQGLNPPMVQKIKHHVTTASDGRFLFSFLRAGDYQLQAMASGLGPVTRNVTLPSPTGEYDLQF